MSSLTFSSESPSNNINPYRVLKFVPPDDKKWIKRISSSTLMSRTVTWGPAEQTYENTHEFIKATFATKANYSVQRYYAHIVDSFTKAYPMAKSEIVVAKASAVLFALWNPEKGRESFQLTLLKRFGNEYFSLGYITTNLENSGDTLFWIKCSIMLGNAEFFSGS